MDNPDFGLDDEPSGIVSDYSDGTPVISYALVDADGAVLRERAATLPYYSASTVKVGVLVAALRKVQAGTWHLSDPLTVTHEYASIVPDAPRFVMEIEETDPGLGAPGDTVTLAHVLNRMTTVSANCATNMLFEALGADQVAAVSRDAGAPDTGMDRPYSDVAGLEAGITNRASALGLARLMAALVRGDLLDTEHTNIAKQLLREREEPVISAVTSAVGRQNAVVTDTGSKGGSVDGIAHDFAFIERDGTMQCLAVCTRGYTYEQGAAAISAVTAALLASCPGAPAADGPASPIGAHA